jgi:Glycosyltransferase family 87
LFSGQNGLLTAVILIGGLVAITRQPRLAGCILALLSFKPQFCLALPIFLIIERRTHTIAASAVTFCLLMAFSTGLWGAVRSSSCRRDVLRLRCHRQLTLDLARRNLSYAAAFAALRIFWD